MRNGGTWVLCLALMGCGGSDGTISSEDSGGPADGTTEDSGSPADSATEDTRVTADGGDDTATTSTDSGTAALDSGMLDSGTPADSGPKTDSGSGADTSTADAGPSTSPTLAGCPLLPSNHLFNTRIDSLPVHANSAAFLGTIGTAKIHLDMGQSENMAAPATYWGIPYNVVKGNTLTWKSVVYTSKDPSLTWNPRVESDCASGAAHTLVSPCTAAAAPAPLLPIPDSPKVEGGVFPDVTGGEYGDHHILMLDSDTCRLWEIYHAYSGTGGAWNIFGSATWNLKSNALRPAEWTSADAAGFPILPLLLRADEASSGVIRHALRFTIPSNRIRNSYVWPARHLTNNGTLSTSLPPMGQLFRLKASYVIPATYSTQSKAILTALKQYGMYIADGGSSMYVQGEPSAAWSDTVFSEVQSVSATQFEAVDLAPIMSRAGFDVNSGAVP